MSEQKDGGHAFPVPHVTHDSGYNEPVYFQGMTLRDYYIAHAPAEKWSWYKPVVDGYPYIVPDYRFDDTNKEQAQAARMEYQMHLQRKDEMEHKYKRQYDIQWPAFWADAMLAERNKP